MGCYSAAAKLVPCLNGLGWLNNTETHIPQVLTCPLKEAGLTKVKTRLLFLTNANVEGGGGEVFRPFQGQFVHPVK